MNASADAEIPRGIPRDEHGRPDGSMNVTVRRDGPGTAAVRITGEVEPGQADELRLALLAALDACPGGISLDVARARFRDGSGLNALLDVEREAAARHRPLTVTAAPPAVRRLLDVAGPPAPATGGAVPGTVRPGTAPPQPRGVHGFEVCRALLEAQDADGGHWVVFLEGSVEPDERSALRHALAGADPGTPAYVVELGGLRLMTPAATAVLAELGRTLSAHGRRLLLVGPHRLTDPVVQLSRTSGFVEFHAHLDRALASARASGPGHRGADRPGPVDGRTGGRPV
ncbi:STAS domain-containing protein [Streptomyces sp. NPDC058157]|uniref:STAS domain-containing protein n=1 Tax=Streptomyces sp. NPDC058157 TaxID=3346360 RepID=UPI0036E8EFDC